MTSLLKQDHTMTDQSQLNYSQHTYHICEQTNDS